MNKRLNLDLSQTQYSLLKKLSLETGYSMAKILEISLSFYAEILAEINQGNELCIINLNGDITRLIIVF